MHIPDGYIGPITYGILWIAMIPIWLYAGNWLKKNLKDRQVPYLALAAAFSFVIMMFNLPIPGGSTGHAVGSALIAIILGPWVAVVTCLLYTSPNPRDRLTSRMPSSACNKKTTTSPHPTT